MESNPIDVAVYCLRRALREVLDELGYVGVVPVESSSKGLEPESTYVLFDIPDLQQVGRGEKSSYLMGDRKSYVKKGYKAFTQITAVGDDSRGIISSIHSRIPESSKMREIFHKWGFSILNKTSVRRNPQKREGEWVDTYNLGINLTFSYYFKEDSEWFELVTANGYEFRIADNI